jgi:dienelactone hydrolase
MPATSPADRYRQWLTETGRRLRAGDPPPSTRAEARRHAEAVRKRIRLADGGWPRDKAALDAQVLGVLERDGYRAERLIFQTRGGCYATATAYVPTGAGPFPAVLCPHGHWQGARRDPVVQSRCIGLAKLGFLVLTLDAWGAGERGTQPGQNEYHGGLLGASLWTVGTPLHGMQLYDNVRALDYLQFRPDVDGNRIGCTGASGGGNQTTYLSAFDERVRCAVPVCSVGTWQSYLEAACCVDEVLIGALTFAEEGDLLGMVAPRPLMVITATRDTYHFGPEAASQALALARPRFQVHDSETKLRHVLIESGHDYSQPMREAMYGWMRRWLKDEGDGSPTPEPPIQTEDPETLRCFEPGARPAKVMTTVRWVKERAEQRAGEAVLPRRTTNWERERTKRLLRLRELLALDDPPGQPFAAIRGDGAGRSGTVLLLHPLGAEEALGSPLAARLRQQGMGTRALELRGCGELTLAEQGLGGTIPDHNLVEWSLWIGKPLLGQWIADILSAVAGHDRLTVVGWREAGLAALLAAALEERIQAVAAIEAPATYLTEGPPHNQRMVIFQPDLLAVGDVPQLAALAAPRSVLVANPMLLNGSPAGAAQTESLYRSPADLYRTLGHPDRFTARAGLTDAETARFIEHG